MFPGEVCIARAAVNESVCVTDIQFFIFNFHILNLLVVASHLQQKCI